MGVFMGDSPSNDAVKCAREIDYVVYHALNPKVRAKFDSIKNNDINIRHCIGIDHGDVRAVRGGIRDNNDLIWIGKPPSFAAKLSDVRDHPREVFISSRVYSRLNEDQKVVSGASIWARQTFTFAGTSEYIYSTTTPREP
jgi:class 3 adenylate cyclase